MVVWENGREARAPQKRPAASSCTPRPERGHPLGIASELTSSVLYAKRRRDLLCTRILQGDERGIFSDGMAGLEQNFIVSNKLGIHARVAAQIVKVATQYDCELWVMKEGGDGTRVNGKSILDLMTLICPQGTKIRILARGKDAADALEALTALFQTKFGES